MYDNCSLFEMKSDETNSSAFVWSWRHSCGRTEAMDRWEGCLDLTARYSTSCCLHEEGRGGVFWWGGAEQPCKDYQCCYPHPNNVYVGTHSAELYGELGDNLNSSIQLLKELNIEIIFQLSICNISASFEVVSFNISQDVQTSKFVIITMLPACLPAILHVHLCNFHFGCKIAVECCVIFGENRGGVGLLRSFLLIFYLKMTAS